MSRVTLLELERRIRRAARRLQATYTGSSAAKAYEAYCWILTLEAVEQHTMQPVTLRQLGQNNEIVLPGAPALSPSRYTYGEAATGLEIHAGLRVRGRSGVAHELDVSVLDPPGHRQVPPPGYVPGSRVRLGIEAKFYSGALGLDIGRAALGLNSDMWCRVRLATNRDAPRVVTLLTNRTRKAQAVDKLRPGWKHQELVAVQAIRAGL
jgi:hypothetical protein